MEIKSLILHTERLESALAQLALEYDLDAHDPAYLQIINAVAGVKAVILFLTRLSDLNQRN